LDYSLLKHSHAGLAYLTILLFVGRFVLFYFYPVLRRNKVFKIVPHVLDTLLLVSNNTTRKKIQKTNSHKPYPKKHPK